MKLLLCMCLFLPGIALSQNFKCVVDGKPVYTNRPCQPITAAAENDQRTAAQIQAEFERERDAAIAKRAAQQKADAATRLERAEIIERRSAPQPAPPSESPSVAASGMGMGMVVFLIGLYFLPAIIAGGRGHHNQTAIFFLNLLLGWSGLGWIAAFIWAVTAVHETKAGKIVS